MSSLIDSLSEFVEKERQSDLKYKIGDRVPSINFDATPTIAYDYLFLENGHEHSFCNNEFNNISSEEYPGKSDYAIYFEKIKEFCHRTLQKSLSDSNYKEHIHIVDPNPKIKEILGKVFNKSLKDEDWPPILQFCLYTNKNGEEKSPRIFCAVGNYAVIHILFYDPFHKVFNSKLKKKVNK